jgi:hypothetical protein
MRRRAWSFWGAALVLAGTALANGAASPAAPPTPHEDGKATEQAVLDATRAFLREDLAAAREALDRIEAGCRRLGPDDVQAYGSEVVAYDKAVHAALSASRELARAADLQRSWEQFMWVTKGCRVCHGMVRTAAATAGTGPR